MSALSRIEAQDITYGIRQALHRMLRLNGDLVAMIEDAKLRGVHEVLGYPSWTAYVAAEFKGQLEQISRADRVDVVQALTGTGMSTRAIADVVGVSEGTVRNDRKQVRSDYAPAGEVPTARETTPVRDKTPPLGGTPDITSPARVTGLDGKQYAARPRPVPPPDVDPDTGEITDQPTKPSLERRRPLPEQLEQATWDLTQAARRITRLTRDDRFGQHAGKVAPRTRGDLLRARHAIDEALTQLPTQGA